MFDEPMLTREELAQLLHVTPRTIYNYEKSGDLPAPIKIGRRHLWPRSTLVAFFEAQTGVPEQESAVEGAVAIGDAGTP